MVSAQDHRFVLLADDSDVAVFIRLRDREERTRDFGDLNSCSEFALDTTWGYH